MHYVGILLLVVNVLLDVYLVFDITDDQIGVDIVQYLRCNRCDKIVVT